MLHPEIEWRPPRQGTLDEVYRGHHGVERLFEALFDSWGTLTHEPVGFVELGTRLVIVTHLRATGRTSGVELDELWGYVVEFDDGLFRRIWMYTSPAAAMEAAQAA
jgi:ketosteroid isomerase-like protein